MQPVIQHAASWFAGSGIQEPNGGVARYYRADLGRNNPVSTEITGYALSAFVYLHSLTADPAWLERAHRAARFLCRDAWGAGAAMMPFEVGRPAAYFFDSGIIVRGLLAAHSATGESEYLETAAAIGRSMTAHAIGNNGHHNPILRLPDLAPESHDAARWSRSPGCYQLKSAMAWHGLSLATGEPGFRLAYERTLESALEDAPRFLPGHPDPLRVMDRLHAFSYFLEGMLPVADGECAATALTDGITRLAAFLREIAPRFERSDVYAQLLRVRLFAHWAGAVPLDREAAGWEAARLAEFQAVSPDPRLDGGFWFGRTPQGFLPYSNPVSTAFALQALAMWDTVQSGGAPPKLDMLI